MIAEISRGCVTIDDVIRKHIEIVDKGSGPVAKIIGHRVNVSHIAMYHEGEGMSPTEIAGASESSWTPLTPQRPNTSSPVTTICSSLLVTPDLAGCRS